MGTLRIRYLGGPTALLEYGELRLLVDPTFDPPGDYPVGARVLRKTLGVWISGVELALGEFDKLDHLPHKLLLCGGGSCLERRTT